MSDPAGTASAPGRDLIDALLGARIVDLEQPRQMHAPVLPVHWPGHTFWLHRRHEPGPERRSGASGMIVTSEHAGTHVDALCHQAYDMCMHGGVPVGPELQGQHGFAELGLETIAPLIRRGVLLDVAAAHADPLPPGSAITADMLRETAAAQSVEIRPGSVVLVRTGYGAVWGDPPRYLRAAGVDRGGSEWLAQQGVFAVGADNVVWDQPDVHDPELGCTLPGHVVLLVRAGIYIIENLLLEELAGIGAREFAFVCLPLKYQGGTGSPVRPVALVSAPAEPSEPS